MAPPSFRPAGPGSRGGQAKAVVQNRVAASRGGQAKAVSPGSRGGQAKPVGSGVRTIRTMPENPMLPVFRQTLSQINALAPQVNEANVRAPYDSASVIAGQLGQGFQAATLAGSQNAMDQYAQQHKAIQEHAASFGAGAGAPVEATPDSGSLLLAQQSEAHQASAAAAAAAWQSMLNQAATGAVSAAQLDRQHTLDSSRQSLALAYPSMVSDDRNYKLQAKTENDNLQALYAQLTEKQRASLTDEKLKLAGINATIGGQKSTASAAQARLDESHRHNVATEAATIAKQRAAAKQGVKGMKEVMALNPKAGATINAPAGFRASIQQVDTDGSAISPVIQGVHLSDVRPGHTGLKDGWQIVGTAQPATVKRTSGAEGFDWGKYRQQLNILMASNREWNDGKPMTRAQAASFLPPTPKTGKKKK